MSSDPRELSTPRLRLRPLVRADAPALALLRDDPEVALHQSWEHYSEADALALIRQVADGVPGTPGQWFQWAIEHRGDTRIVLQRRIGPGCDPDASRGRDAARVVGWRRTRRVAAGHAPAGPALIQSPPRRPPAHGPRPARWTSRRSSRR